MGTDKKYALTMLCVLYLSLGGATIVFSCVHTLG